MAIKQIHKRSLAFTPYKKEEPVVKEKKQEEVEVKKNKKVKSEEMTKEQIERAEELAKFDAPVKVMKKDRGLIERTESSKVILAEDNRQLLND